MRSTIEGERLNLTNLTPHERMPILQFYSRLNHPMSQYFTIDGYNYWYLLNYLIYFTPGRLMGAPGIDVVCRCVDLLKDREKPKLVGDKQGEVVARIMRHLGKRGSTRAAKEPSRLLLKSYVKGRILARALTGLIRRSCGRRPRAADVLFLTNLRFHRKGENDLYQSIMDLCSKNGISNQALLYSAIPQVHYLLKFIRTDLFTEEAYLGDFYSGIVLRRSRAIAKRLKHQWECVRTEKEFREHFRYRGVDIFPLLEPRLELVFNSLGPIVADAAAVTEAVLQTSKPRVLVMDHEENLYGKAFMLHQRKYKDLKSIALSFELIYPGCNHEHVEDTRVRKKPIPTWRPLPDIKCVPGHYQATVLLQHCNYPSRHIRVTGSPKLDRLVSMKPHGPKKYVLVMSQTDVTNPEYYISIAEQNPKYQWIIKPHPESHEPCVESLRKISLPRNLKLAKRHDDSYRLLRDSFALLSTYSSTSYEAAVIGKPVLTFNPEKWDLSQNPYVPNKSGIEVRTLTEIQKALHLLGDAKQYRDISNRMRKFGRRVHISDDGESSKRVFSEIQKALSK